MTEIMPELEPWDVLNEELADTLDAERTKNQRKYRLRLDRIRDAAPPAKRLNGCDFCGQKTLPGRRVCHAHSDIA